MSNVITTITQDEMVLVVDTSAFEVDINRVADEVKGITIVLDGEQNPDETCKQLEQRQILLKSFEKEVEAAFKEPVAERYAAWKELTEKRKQVLDVVTAAYKMASRKIGAYRAELQRIQDEERAAARALEAKIIEDERLELAEQIEQSEGAAAAEKYLEEVSTAPINTSHVSVPSLQPEISKGAQLRYTYDVEVHDETQIPREYMQPNITAIKAFIKATKGEKPIPGILIIKTPQHHVKAQ